VSSAGSDCHRVFGNNLHGDELALMLGYLEGDGRSTQAECAPEPKVSWRSNPSLPGRSSSW